MKTKWIEGKGSVVSCDDLNLALHNRVEFLKKEIEYLLSCNPASDTLEASPTANRYANGMIRAYEKEIDFIQTL